MSYSPPNTDVKVSGSITAADTGSTTATGYSNQNVITGTPTTNSFIQLQIQTASSVTFAISGNLSGTLVFERSLDGVQWAQFGCFPANTPNTTTTVVSTGGTTGQGDFHGLLASHGYARIRCTAFTSGSATINIQASPSTGTVSVNSPIRIMAADGTVTAVKPASTAPVAADNSIVTTTSPNSPDISSLSTIAANSSNAATAARQDTGNTSLGTISTNTGRIPAQGAAATTASLPVNIANDQTVPVSNTNLTTIATNTGNIPAKGTATITGSTPVNIASDQVTTLATSANQTNGNQQMQGNVAHLGTDAGNPVKVAAVYRNSFPAPATGQRVDLQVDSAGFLNVRLGGASAGGGITMPTMSSDSVSTASIGLAEQSFSMGYNGASWDRLKTAPGALATGVGTLAVQPVPSSTGFGLTSYQATAITALTAVKASAGRVHRIIVQNPNTSLTWLQVFNAATTGAVTLGTTVPLYSLPVLASGVFEDFFEYSDTFSAGIVIAATTTATGATAPTTGLFVSLGYV